ncbi:hypothetical protein Dda_1525 [Drechslerella dactyloides]|uniref:Uncharacterized protein n=1 Tax=Drechslerella dactyloides TaxID=74499 RepID=A0AAD6J379_DREDA|nr:hypothetical protein Dda_1525 [Drechslerella dactyloides]
MLWPCTGRHELLVPNAQPPTITRPPTPNSHDVSETSSSWLHQHWAAQIFDDGVSASSQVTRLPMQRLEHRNEERQATPHQPGVVYSFILVEEE